MAKENQAPLQTMGQGTNEAARQAAVNDTNDIQITPAKAGAQLDKGPTEGAQPKLTSGLPTPKRANFAASKEDPKLLAKMSGDPKNDVAGRINGESAFIDGYLRIQKRRYGSRGQYGIISKGYRI